jgi:hypothetical protein
MKKTLLAALAVLAIAPAHAALFSGELPLTTLSDIDFVCDDFGGGPTIKVGLRPSEGVLVIDGKSLPITKSLVVFNYDAHPYADHYARHPRLASIETGGVISLTLLNFSLRYNYDDIHLLRGKDNYFCRS